MGKRFRLRISRIFPISFQPCGSTKDHSHDNEYDDVPTPVPTSFSRFPPVTPTVPTKTRPHRSCSIGRHVSSALRSCGMAVRSRSRPPALSSDDDGGDGRGRTVSPPRPAKEADQFQWEKEEEYWQVVEITETPRRKIYNSSADENDAVLPPPPPPPSSAEKKKRTTKRRAKQKRKKKNRPSSTRLGPGSVRVSTSSAESGLFTSETFEFVDGDDDDETETLVSSSRRSFSTDSSSHGRNKTTTEKKKKKTKRRNSAESELTESAQSTPARLSVFQRMIPCSVEGKVRESFAVVKRSDDPYEDFKRSMAEMILEKQMFDDGELEQLLHCFLSLNSRTHHGVIVRAFIEIWEALFCAGNGGSGSTSARSSRRVSRAL